MEAKLTTEQLNNMKQNWDYNQGLVVSSDGLSGGLTLLWKQNTQRLCLGDFNEIISHIEKVGGSLRPTRQTDRFRTAISHCSFVDLGHMGSPFTWSWNHPTEGHIHICLDRALATATWKINFPGTEVHHLSMSTSDHSMFEVCLPTLKLHQKRCHPPFCFKAM
nr:hypothetical protein CFP56_34550 [Quercus suber]